MTLATWDPQPTAFDFSAEFSVSISIASPVTGRA